MRDVSEVGSTCADAARFGDGLIEVEMGRVGAAAQRAENEHVEAGKQLARFIGHVANVGAVGDVLDTVSEYGERAVEEMNGNDGAAEEVEGAGDFDRAEVGFGAGIVRVVGEAVVKHGAQSGKRGGIAVDVERAAGEPVESADIVETDDVVGVVMGEEDGVGASDTASDALKPEFGCCVDQDVVLAEVEDGADACAVVARVGGGADGAITGDHGDAVRRAGAKDRE